MYLQAAWPATWLAAAPLAPLCNHLLRSPMILHYYYLY